VKFKKAVDATRHLAGAWKPGLQALRSQDSPHIQAENPQRLLGSADVDKALAPIEPNANRWDFTIGFQHANRKHEFIYWVEIHTGSDKEISVVLKKLEWLKNWLRNDGRELAKFERDIVWVASGGTSFTSGSTQIKKLASVGLRYTGNKLHIPSEHPDPPSSP